MVKAGIISIGVRDFALPVPRLGSIETHSGYGPLPITGLEVHEKFLKKRKRSIAGYQTELRYKHVFEKDGYQIAVSGRLDGLLDEDGVRIEEVKTDFNVEALARSLEAHPDHPYWLQLKMYGYLYYLEHGLIPDMQLLLVSIRDQSFETISTTLQIEQFGEWLDKRLAEVVQEFEQEVNIGVRRKKQASKLKFPFEEARIGQDRLIDEVRSCVEKGNSLMLQAPTGLGKTLGVIYPALQSSLARGAQLIYVTPKNSQHAVARDAVQRLKAQGSKLKALILTAKSKLCLKEETICNPQYCEFAKDYYAKLAQHDVVKKVTKADILDRHRFTKFAKKYEVCPFELSLDCVKQADVVIGDYNYVFSPYNIMGRFSAHYNSSMSSPDLVIDEAHNLPSRACSYYSAAITVEQMRDLDRGMSHLPVHVAFKARAQIKEIIDLIQSYRSSSTSRQDCEIEIDKFRFVQILGRIQQLSAEHLTSLILPSSNDPILELFKVVEGFVTALNNSNKEEFVSLFQTGAGGTIKLVCCDASSKLRDSYRALRSVVSFSATMKPFKYYSDLMGFDSDMLTMKEFQSPFPKENRKLLVIPQISTKYADRQRNYGKIAETIAKITGLRKGNYVIFFPSFDFLNRVKELVHLDGYEELVQQREMTQSLTEQYLNTMRVNSEPIVLYAVQGGVFAEGVDYPGEMLIGTIIVGPALPTYDFERELIMRYFDERYGDGNAYACIYPAMSKVVQSAGRVIRSQDDRGLIVLLGRRFVERAYMDAMPDDWYDESIGELVSSSILADIDNFWRDDGSILPTANERLFADR